MTNKHHAALSEARRLSKDARKGPPSDDDAPHRGAQGRRPLDGQIDIFGVEHRPRGRRPR